MKCEQEKDKVTQQDIICSVHTHANAIIHIDGGIENKKNKKTAKEFSKQRLTEIVECAI